MAPTQRRSATACWLLYHFIRGERLITSRGTQVNDHYILSPGMWPTRALAWGANITPKIRSVIKHPPRVTLRACSGASRCSGAAQNVYCIIVWEKITYNKTFSFRWIMPFWYFFSTRMRPCVYTQLQSFYIFYSFKQLYVYSCTYCDCSRTKFSIFSKAVDLPLVVQQSQ